MKPTPRRVDTRGQRNVNCAYYRNCLDLAVMEKWVSWDCQTCPNKANEQAITLVNTEYDFRHDHSLPSSISRQIR